MLKYSQKVKLKQTFSSDNKQAPHTFDSNLIFSSFSSSVAFLIFSRHPCISDLTVKQIQSFNTSIFLKSPFLYPVIVGFQLSVPSMWKADSPNRSDHCFGDCLLLQAPNWRRQRPHANDPSVPSTFSHQAATLLGPKLREDDVLKQRL